MMNQNLSPNTRRVTTNISYCVCSHSDAKRNSLPAVARTNTALKINTSAQAGADPNPTLSGSSTSTPLLLGAERRLDFLSAR